MIDEARIRAGIKKAVADGWTLEAGMACPNQEERCGCALVVACVGEGIFGIRDYIYAAAALGMTNEERSAFVSGFDAALGGETGNETGPAYLLGTALREEYKVSPLGTVAV